MLKGFAFALPVSFPLGAIDCPKFCGAKPSFALPRIRTEPFKGYAMLGGAIGCPYLFLHMLWGQCKGKTFLHRLLYITEGYVCDVWQCIARIFCFGGNALPDKVTSPSNIAEGDVTLSLC